MTTTTATRLTHPLPFFHHAASGRALYIGAGPCALVFSISLDDVRRHAPVADRGAERHPATHPFGQSTAVASFAADAVRRELGETTTLRPGLLDERLASWANYCDDVADRLNEGVALREALDVWIVGDGQDVILDDESAASTDEHARRPVCRREPAVTADLPSSS